MTLLLLAGSGEAKDIACGLAAAGIKATASLAGATRAPKPLPLPTRIGGFGGDAGFEAYLEAEKITRILDATHPFAHRITDRTARIARERAIPYLQFLRPAWVPQMGDDWTEITHEEEAAALIGSGKTVFLGTGRQTVARFGNLKECRVICRQIDPPDGPFPFAGGEFLIGRPPFAVEAEKALFKELRVDVLVVKNAGGAQSRTKLDAARALGIPVLMIARPQMPDANRVETVADAIAWGAQ